MTRIDLDATLPDIAYMHVFTGIKQVHALVKSLQQFAKDCGHAQPLMIGIDQENGQRILPRILFFF